jgi:WD40 repeat protein
MGGQSAPSQPTPQAQTPAAAPFAALAPAPGEVAIPADAHRLDDILQSGHSSSISSLSFSPNGKWLASGGLDRSIILWNASTGEQIRKWTSQNSNVTELVFSPDSKSLVSADDGGIVRGWKFESAEPEYSLNLHKFVRVLACSVDGRSWAAVVDPGGRSSERAYRTSRCRIRETDSNAEHRVARCYRDDVYAARHSDRVGRRTRQR